MFSLSRGRVFSRRAVGIIFNGGSGMSKKVLCKSSRGVASSTWEKPRGKSRQQTHVSASASHYDVQAAHYDDFNEGSSELMNSRIHNILKRHSVKSVVDFACGTGLQTLWLKKRGYEIAGYDLSTKMLEVARAKAKNEGLKVEFMQGDMRVTKAGNFDAAITMFNAIGHLTREDFEQSIQNIFRNLNSDGIYIFDINNLTYLLSGTNITSLTIDWMRKINPDTLIRKTQHSTVNKAGILTSYTTYREQKGDELPREINHDQTLQIYAPRELRDMLNRQGFQVVEQCNIDGTEIDEATSDSIITVAKRSTLKR